MAMRRTDQDMPPIEWETQAGDRFTLYAHPVRNNELRFDIDQDGGPDRLCSNLTPKAAADIKRRLEQYLAFMSDKAVI